MHITDEHLPYRRPVYDCLFCDSFLINCSLKFCYIKGLLECENYFLPSWNFEFWPTEMTESIYSKCRHPWKTCVINIYCQSVRQTQLSAKRQNVLWYRLIEKRSVFVPERIQMCAIRSEFPNSNLNWWSKLACQQKRPLHWGRPISVTKFSVTFTFTIMGTEFGDCTSVIKIWQKLWISACVRFFSSFLPRLKYWAKVAWIF